MLKIIIVIVLTLVVVVVAAACAQRSQAPSHQDQIQGALVRLLEDPDGGFVIIAVPHSGKFLQFAANAGSGLLLDLPQQTLSQDEMEKAKAVFSARGYPGPETHDGQTSFQKNFGKGVDKATELAVAVIQQVYGLQDHSTLQITEQLDSDDDFAR